MQFLPKQTHFCAKQEGNGQTCRRKEVSQLTAY